MGVNFKYLFCNCFQEILGNLDLRAWLVWLEQKEHEENQGQEEKMASWAHQEDQENLA